MGKTRVRGGGRKESYTGQLGDKSQREYMLMHSRIEEARREKKEGRLLKPTSKIIRQEGELGGKNCRHITQPRRQLLVIKGAKEGGEE